MRYKDAWYYFERCLRNMFSEDPPAGVNWYSPIWLSTRGLILLLSPVLVLIFAGMALWHCRK